MEQSRGCATNEISQDDIMKVGGTCRRVAFDLLPLFLLYHTPYVLFITRSVRNSYSTSAVHHFT